MADQKMGDWVQYTDEGGVFHFFNLVQVAFAQYNPEAPKSGEAPLELTFVGVADKLKLGGEAAEKLFAFLKYAKKF